LLQGGCILRKGTSITNSNYLGKGKWKESCPIYYVGRRRRKKNLAVSKFCRTRGTLRWKLFERERSPNGAGGEYSLGRTGLTLNRMMMEGRNEEARRKTTLKKLKR